MIVVRFIVLAWLGYWFYQKRGVGLVLIMMGGFGNWIQWVIFGKVFDYWRFWGTQIYNNLWDWLISIGIIIFLYEQWSKKK